MNSQFLKNKIGAYLDDTSVLTKGEVEELLTDCLSYFEEQDEKKSKFRDIYKGIMKNATRQREEASAIMEGFGALSDAIERMKQDVATEEKSTED